MLEKGRSGEQPHKTSVPEQVLDARIQGPAYPLLPKFSERVDAAVRSEAVTVERRSRFGSRIPQLLGPHERPNDFAEVMFVLGDQVGLPDQYTTITKSLASALAPLQRVHRPEAYLRSVFDALAAERPEHVTAFKRDSLNKFNQLYYRAPRALSDSPGVFNRNSLVVNALAQLVAEQMPAGDLNLKEICCGADWERRWAKTLSACGPQEVTLTMSDFSTPIESGSIGALAAAKKLRLEAFNLLEPLMELRQAERFHGILAFYRFDSVWFPQDVTLVKTPSIPWCECLYRIAVPDWHPQREKMHLAFQSGQVGELSVDDFRLLTVERVLRPYPVDAHPELVKLLEERLTHSPRVQISAPLGVVGYVEELFDKQLHKQGCVVIGDVGTSDPSIPAVHDFMSTPLGAKYKGIDFHMAAKLLEGRGFEVVVHNLAELALPHATQSTTHELEALIGELHTHVMVVKKGRVLAAEG
jgi:hypothetical protein